MNNRINRLHERELRIVYDDEKSFSQKLLDKDNTSATIHQHNLQILAYEIFKSKL